MTPEPKPHRNGDPRGSLRILAVTNMWPTPNRPWYGVFVASQMQSVAKAGAAVYVHFVDGRRTRLAYLSSALRMLALNFQRKRFDIVHAHTGHCGVLARLQRRYPVLVSYVGYDLNRVAKAGGGFTRKSRIEAFLFRNLARFVDATITKSAAMERRLPARARSRNRVLPNGVDRSLFRPIPRDTACRELGWPEDEVTVLFGADPNKVTKRFDLAQEACRLASVQLPRLRLRVLYGRDQAVVPVWMNAADVLLLTSSSEGSPNVVKEALACNLPVVSVNVGDVGDLLSGVRLCRVVERDADPSTLGEALVEVLRSVPVRSDGRARTRHLSDDLIAARLTAIYRELIASAEARPEEASTGLSASPP